MVPVRHDARNGGHRGHRTGRGFGHLGRFCGQWGRGRQGAGYTHTGSGLLLFKTLDFLDRRFQIFTPLLLPLIFLDEILDIIRAEFLYEEVLVSFPFLDAWFPEMGDLSRKDFGKRFIGVEFGRCRTGTGKPRWPTRMQKISPYFFTLQWKGWLVQAVQERPPSRGFPPRQ